jgi:hypothetical protein
MSRLHIQAGRLAARTTVSKTVNGGSSPSRPAIAFGRTPLGQCVYDVLFSRLSAREVVRRYPDLTRKYVLDMRRKYSKLRTR